MEEQGYQFRDITETDPYQQAMGLIGRMTSEEGMEADAQAAYEYMERMLGMESGEFQSTMQQLNETLNAGISGVEGWTDEQKEAYEKSLAQQVASVRDDTMKVIEALGAEGRTAQAYMAMDEMSSEIADMRLQGEYKLIEADQAARELQYNALAQRYQVLAQQGSAEAQNYLELMQQNRYAALESYANSVTQIQQQNQQYFAIYTQHAQQMYQNLMAELSFDAYWQEKLTAMYEEYMQPWMDQFNAWLAQMQIEMGLEELDLAQIEQGTSFLEAVMGLFVGLAGLFV